MADQVGDNGPNTLIGSDNPETLKGLGGDDTLLGFGGGDVLNGGEGNDTASYVGSLKGVFVTFNDPEPEKFGDAEGDRLLSIENVIGSNAGDAVVGDGNANRFFGLDGADSLFGNAGEDELIGGNGDDDLRGGLGNDELRGGFGADELDGGAGFDHVTYEASNAGVFVDLRQGFANFGEGTGDTLFNIEQVTGSDFGELIRGDDFSNVLNGIGGNDTLEGNGGGDDLFGGLGDDVLKGGDGSDILDGGAGFDAMGGGAGNDNYIVDSTLDLVDEATGGSGVDTVRSSVDFSLAGVKVLGAVENLNLSGSADIDATGNNLANLLRGNSGDNRLAGVGGADTMIGGAGDDTYIVADAGDVVDESTGSGVDEIRSSVSIALGGPQVKGTVEDVRLLGSGNIGADGNAAANDITGNSFVNVLNGGAGNDTLTGGLGGDFFVFSTALNAATNVDVIEDYNVAQDTIRLENAVFTGLSNGFLSAGAFRIGAAAADASDRIIYNSANGDLSFDADGNGAGAAVRFADLDAGLQMTSADFFVI